MKGFGATEGGRGSQCCYSRIIGTYDLTSTILVSEYSVRSRSSSTAMVLISVENCRGGCPDSGSLIQKLRGARASQCTRQRSLGRLTSNKRPSIFNCHAEMPWPVLLLYLCRKSQASGNGWLLSMKSKHKCTWVKRVTDKISRSYLRINSLPNVKVTATAWNGLAWEFSTR